MLQWEVVSSLHHYSLPPSFLHLLPSYFRGVKLKLNPCGERKEGVGGMERGREVERKELVSWIWEGRKELVG